MARTIYIGNVKNAICWHLISTKRRDMCGHSSPSMKSDAQWNWFFVSFSNVFHLLSIEEKVLGTFLSRVFFACWWPKELEVEKNEEEEENLCLALLNHLWGKKVHYWYYGFLSNNFLLSWEKFSKNSNFALKIEIINHRHAAITCWLLKYMLVQHKSCIFSNLYAVIKCITYVLEVLS